MKIIWRDNAMVLVPTEPLEKQNFKKMFAPKHPKNPGRQKVTLKETVDDFGKGKGEYYLEVKATQILKGA